MLVRKPGAILSSYGNLFSLSSSFSESSTSSKRKRASTRQQSCCQHGVKSYATITGEGRQHDEHHEQEQHQWPIAPKGQSHPTPYQIFRMEQKTVYSKARFYELVKIYHPDRKVMLNEDAALPDGVKMERYRLIVAANNILSDPTKRIAYDRFGSGWNGRADVGGRQNWSKKESTGPFSHNWSPPPDDSIWRNATWEDWEKYYYQRAKAAGKTTDDVRPPYGAGLYMNNGYFVILLAVLALLGSTANYNRAQGAGQYYVDQRDIVHDRDSKVLRDVRKEAIGSDRRQDQIDWFLRNREAALGRAGSDAEVLRQEKIDKLLPDREVCKSDGISEKD